MTIEQQRLKVSLTIAIERWLKEQCENDPDDYISLGIMVHNTICEDMANAAFNHILTIQKTMEYLRKEDLLQS